MKATVLTIFYCFSAVVLCKSQLVANFKTSNDINGGCSPFTVSFQNLTTGASTNATYKWAHGKDRELVMVRLSRWRTRPDEADAAVAGSVGHRSLRNLAHPHGASLCRNSGDGPLEPGRGLDVEVLHDDGPTLRSRRRGTVPAQRWRDVGAGAAVVDRDQPLGHEGRTAQRQRPSFRFHGQCRLRCARSQRRHRGQTSHHGQCWGPSRSSHPPPGHSHSGPSSVQSVT